MESVKVEGIPEFPAGPVVGVIIHRLFEKFFAKKLSIEDLVREELRGSCLQGYEAQVLSMMQGVLALPLFGNMKLAEIPRENLFTEMEFLYPANNGFTKGFADLIVVYQEKYYLIDWKTNWLGNDPSCYTQDKLHAEMEKHNYFLQAEIYLEALQKALKMFHREIGGCFYVFVRGCAVYKI